MNIVLLGGGGFIGTNLSKQLYLNKSNNITIVDHNCDNYEKVFTGDFSNVSFIKVRLGNDTDFEQIVRDQDIVYHLISTTVPATSNQHITDEVTSNIVLSTRLFDACIKCKVKKIVFLSSGGAVYGKDSMCPLGEESPVNPISTYGMQKVSIEKLLYIYNYMFGIDYRIIRLSNPYGPYQLPNGVLGAVTTFVYKTLKNEEITVFGDGSVTRDYIYIDDAVKGIIKIVNGTSQFKLFNLGRGRGTSLNQLIDIIRDTIGYEPRVRYEGARRVDVPSNYLDIRRYEMVYGDLDPIDLKQGIIKTAEFLKESYGINNTREGI